MTEIIRAYGIVGNVEQAEMVNQHSTAQHLLHLHIHSYYLFSTLSLETIAKITLHLIYICSIVLRRYQHSMTWTLSLTRRSCTMS